MPFLMILLKCLLKECLIFIHRLGLLGKHMHTKVRESTSFYVLVTIFCGGASGSLFNLNKRNWRRPESILNPESYCQVPRKSTTIVTAWMKGCHNEEMVERGMSLLMLA